MHGSGKRASEVTVLADQDDKNLPRPDAAALAHALREQGVREQVISLDVCKDKLKAASLDADDGISTNAFADRPSKGAI